MKTSKTLFYFKQFHFFENNFSTPLLKGISAHIKKQPTEVGCFFATIKGEYIFIYLRKLHRKLAFRLVQFSTIEEAPVLFYSTTKSPSLR